MQCIARNEREVINVGLNIDDMDCSSSFRIALRFAGELLSCCHRGKAALSPLCSVLEVLFTLLSATTDEG